MPLVEITRREAEQHQLPDVCMCCGRRASQRRQVDFFEGAGRILLYAPLCRRHRHHFHSRSRVLVFGLAGSIIFLILGPIVIRNAMGVRPPLTMLLLGLLWLALGLAGIASSVVLFFFLKYNGIRVRGVTSDGVRLTGVSLEFVEALLEQRESRKKTAGLLPGRVSETAEAENWLESLPLGEDTRRAFAESRIAALDLGDDHLGTQHLLIGLANAVPGAAAHFLNTLGVNEGEIRACLELGQDHASAAKELPPTPVVRRIVHNALTQARTGQNVLVSSEYVLLALLDESDSNAVEVLRTMDVDPEKVRGLILDGSRRGQFRAEERMVTRSEAFKAADS